MGGSGGFRPAAWVRAAARAGQLAEERAGLSLGHVSEQEVRRRASRRLGRPVVGDDPGLRVLLADAAKAPLTPLGRSGYATSWSAAASPRHGWRTSSTASRG